MVNKVQPQNTAEQQPSSSGANAGAALLQRLTSPQKQTGNDNDDDDLVDGSQVNKNFRTLASVEAEMMSPNQKAGKAGEGGGTNVGKSGENTEEGKAHEEQTKPEPAVPPAPDPIMDLMNPGRHAGGYGMPLPPQQQQQHHHHPYQQYPGHMQQYHAPQHHPMYQHQMHQQKY